MSFVKRFEILMLALFIQGCAIDESLFGNEPSHEMRQTHIQACREALMVRTQWTTGVPCHQPESLETVVRKINPWTGADRFRISLNVLPDGAYPIIDRMTYIQAGDVFENEADLECGEVDRSLEQIEFECLLKAKAESINHRFILKRINLSGTHCVFSTSFEAKFPDSECNFSHYSRDYSVCINGQWFPSLRPQSKVET